MAELFAICFWGYFWAEGMGLLLRNSFYFFQPSRSHVALPRTISSARRRSFRTTGILEAEWGQPELGQRLVLHASAVYCPLIEIPYGFVPAKICPGSAFDLSLQQFHSVGFIS